MNDEAARQGRHANRKFPAADDSATSGDQLQLDLAVGAEYARIVAERLRVFLEHRALTGGVFDPQGPIPFR